MGDPFAPLKTWEGTSPWPWKIHGTNEGNVLDSDGDALFVPTKPSDDPSEDGVVAFPCDAHHIATWGPDTCSEVVALLEAASDAAHPAMSSWHERLDALLTRLAKEPTP